VAPHAEPGPTYEFGGFRLLPGERLLLRDGMPIPLTPKAFDLLVYFVERPGRLIEKAALLDALWPEVAVEEANVAFQISALRKAMEPGGADLIQTVPTKGYRFIGQVRKAEHVAAETPAARPAGPLLAGASRGRFARPSTLLVAGACALAVAATGVWGIRVSRSSGGAPIEQGTPSPPRVVRITSGPGLQTQASWSPDGRQIAYAADTAGNLDIWIQSTEGAEPRALTTAKSQDDQPAWSPDGRHVVFHSDREGGGLFVVPSTGGPERRLTTFGVRPRWAPDGKRIFFASSDVHDFGGSLPRFHTVGLDGAAPVEVLRDALTSLGSVRDWDWYPDGQRITVLGDSARYQLGLWTFPLAGGTPAVLAKPPEDNDWSQFAWDPMGRAVYVATVWGFAELTRLTLDERLTTVRGRERLAAADTGYSGLAVSHDGRRVAFTTERRTLRLWSTTLDARGVAEGHGTPVTDPGAMALSSSLDRTGRMLAYVLDREGVGQELWVADLQTGQHRQLTTDHQWRAAPAWSPDGSQLAYVWTASGEFAPAVRRMDSNEERLLVAPFHGPGGVRFPEGGWAGLPSDWSPDGTFLLASSHRGKTATLELWPVALAPHADRGVKVLASDTQSDMWEARFSPDGRFIAFLSNDRPDRPGESRVMVMPSDGTSPERWVPITPRDEWCDKPRWSHDGRLIYYTRWGGSYWNVWARPIDPSSGVPRGDAFQVTQFDSPRHQLSPGFQDAEISVGSGRLIVPIMEREGSVWMAERR
jgi:Tol biopolymer transport system component/DNA-binding winged helix-turn-helix (wHTH) protein